MHLKMYILFLIIVQLSIEVEMREKNDDNDVSRLIDVFEIPANSSNCNKAIQLDGDLGVASIMFKFELTFAKMCTCEPVKNSSLAACSKISDTCMQMSFKMNIFIHVYLNEK